jgi:hypothetical protein
MSRVISTPIPASQFEEPSFTALPGGPTSGAFTSRASSSAFCAFV